MKGGLVATILITLVCVTGCKRSNHDSDQSQAKVSTNSAANEHADSNDQAGGDDGSVFWPGDYHPTGISKPSDGWHYPGTDCLPCHTGNEWSFVASGTVYQKDGKTGLAHVQVGVRNGRRFWSGYSGTNGNFWLSDNGIPIDWNTAQVRVRNADGEISGDSGKVKMSGSCNKCHKGEKNLTGPEGNSTPN